MKCNPFHLETNRKIRTNMKKILILANSASGLYDFRNELIISLLEQYEVHIALPDAEKVPELAKEGCIIHHTPIDRRGMNPKTDWKLMKQYKEIMKQVKPDCVLTYTIKPNIYGNLCCRRLRIPYLVNITGLGSAFENGGLIQKLVVFLYRVALKKANCIFFQNDTNRAIFEEFGIRGKHSRLVPGSGVNLDRHAFEEYPSKEEKPVLLYVGRIMKEKGADELFYAAKKIKQEYPDVQFELVGYYEDDYKELVEQYEKEGILKLTSYQKEIHPYYKRAAAVIMPSYHEGMSNVILEASATGRPVLASKIPGCIEGFEEGKTGIGFEARNPEALYQAIRSFLQLSYEERKEMGQNARMKMERDFDRKKVVAAYREEIEKAI